MLSIVLLIALLLALYFIPHWRRLRPPANLMWYQRAANKAEQLTGVARHNLGPKAYAEKVQNSFEPQTAALFKALTDAFIVQQYGGHPVSTHTDNLFKKRCKQFIKHGRATPHN
ncbi:MAG: hypothetical protein HWE26_07570 [Alteromonadaceae bacterium]|nr:hypothetical protein [Alteromonadaceae bacterium]